MKQKFTSEKNKELKSLNESKFNFKISCLMKKQIFTLMIALAMVILAGGSAMAQGLLPDDPRLVAKGSMSQFTITETGTAAESVVWTVLDLAQADADAFTGSTAATAGTQYQFVTSLSNEATDDPTDGLTAYVKWLDVPANDVYAVQVTSSYSAPSTCSTVRRFYISVFDFEVNVYLADNAGAISGAPAYADMFTAAYDEGAITTLNSWHSNVIQNTITDAQLAARHADFVNNTVDNENKYTETYFAVRITLTASSGSVDLDMLKWRFRYSIENPAILDLYEIQQVAGPSTVTFLDGANDYIRAVDVNNSIPLATTTAWDANNEVAVPAIGGGGGTRQAQYLFRVRTHNMAGQNLAMNWDVQVNEVQIETTDASSTYNDGRKVHSSLAASYNNPVLLVDGQSAIQSITQSPATSVIGIAD